MTVSARQATASAEIAGSIEILRSHTDKWAQLSITRKINYLRSIRDATNAAAEDWVNAAVAAKRIPENSQLAGEEWMSGPWALMRGANDLIRTLESISEKKPIVPARSISRSRNGQVVAKVFPNSIFDRLLLNRFSAEVWMQPDVTAETLGQNMAAFYRKAAPTGGVGVVLGAGNIASIAPLDVLYKMFAEGMVVILKMNPVNDYLGEFLEKIFAPLVRDGFLRFAYGGADVGAYLVSHEGIEDVHVTGDYRTYNAIVFGAGADGEARRLRDDPVLQKPVSAELGNVSPTIVVPGPWSKADIQYQAEHIVTQKSHNAGFNCIATQVLVLPAEWKQTDELVDAIRSTIREQKSRFPYYPGAEIRQKGALQNSPRSEIIQGETPRVLIEADSNDSATYCFKTEFFSDVLAITRLPGKTAEEFLSNAARFCNETLWGTLGANILIHPTTAKRSRDALDKAIQDLRYGCIGVNAWIGVGFLLSQVAWGAFPGHTRNDIRSGIGVAHNSLLFDKPQKSVVRQPFHPFPRNLLNLQFHIAPKPPWFVTNRQAHNVAKRITRFEAKPGWRHIPGIFLAALRG